MALTSLEQLVSQDSEQDSDTGQRRAMRRFKVWDTTAGATVTPTAALSAPGLPPAGDLFPGSTTLFRKGFRAARTEGDNNLVLIEYEYRETAAGSGTLPQEEGFVEFSSSFVTEFEDFWRTDDTSALSIPSFGIVSNNNTADIGGTFSDINGRPISVPVKKGIIEIAETFVGTPNLAFFWAQLNKRNNSVFQNFAAGSLVYLGTNHRRISLDKTTVSHAWAFDSFFHLRQVPKLLDNGDPQTININPFGTEIRIAERVYWRQPYPKFFDFNTFSTHF